MLFLVLVIVFIAAAGSIILINSRFRKKDRDPEQKGNWVQFYAKGKDSGFSFKEIELLRRLAVKSELEDPSSLFWSQSQLDQCIRALVKSSRLAGTEQNLEIQDFLSKLYDYRKKIELERPKIKNGLTTTRQIGESQRISILLSGTGVFKSQIIKNAGQYMTITRPAGQPLPQNFSWTGQHLAVYFWRSDDAGYVFDSDVTDEVFSKGLAALQINHSSSLFRTQKRKSVRLKTHKSAYLYILGDGVSPGTIEMAPGLKCIIEDLSDSGCAITIGGNARVGLRVKIQFVLNEGPLIMCGTVRSINYQEDMNRSTLHVESDPLSMETRNRILGEVFGMISNEDEVLPFRVLDEEAGNNEENQSNINPNAI
jgi:c-di-GMP-binding flagellar brake protein YcgR